jgi:hypothetical protein
MSMNKSMTAMQTMTFIRRADDASVWREMFDLQTKLPKAKSPKHKKRIISLLGMYMSEAKRRGISGPVRGIVKDKATGILYRV